MAQLVDSLQVISMQPWLTIQHHHPYNGLLFQGILKIFWNQLPWISFWFLVMERPAVGEPFFVTIIFFQAAFIATLSLITSTPVAASKISSPYITKCNIFYHLPKQPLENNFITAEKVISQSCWFLKHPVCIYHCRKDQETMIVVITVMTFPTL